MTRLYDNERKELYGSIRHKLGHGLAFYYFIWFAVMVESNFQSDVLFSALFLIWLPLISSIFYFLGVVLNYQPKERFLPKPTIRRMLYPHDHRSREQVKIDKAGRQLAKIHNEDRAQKRNDDWRRTIKGSPF